jgi:hypothetical protein
MRDELSNLLTKYGAERVDMQLKFGSFKMANPETKLQCTFSINDATSAHACYKEISSIRK